MSTLTPPLTTPLDIDPAQTIKNRVNARLASIKSRINRRISEHVAHYNDTWNNALLPAD